MLIVLADWPGSVHDSRVLHKSFVCLQANNQSPNDTHLLGEWRISPFHVRSSSKYFTIHIHSLSYIYFFEFLHWWYLFNSRWLITPFKDNGHLMANQRQFNSRRSSIRHTITRCNKLLKRLWRNLHFLNHLDMELRLLLMISPCVLHNFSLIHDDTDEGYFGDDGNGGPAIALQRRAEKKRVHIMGLLWLFIKVYMYNCYSA